MFDEFGINAGYVEELHTRWLQSPQSVDSDWRSFFEGRGLAPGSRVAPPPPPSSASALGLDRAAEAPSKNGNGWAPANGNGNGTGALYRESVRETVIAATELQSRVAQLVNAYRVRGHLFAHVDPLGNPADAHPELELANFGLTDADLGKTFSTAGMSGLPERATLRQIVQHLSETYCSSIGVEFTHIEEPEPRLWLQERMESTRNHASLNHSELLRILTKLTEAEIFEQFIHKNYVNARRFSLEGAESVIPMIDFSPSRLRSTASRSWSSAWRIAGD